MRLRPTTRLLLVLFLILQGAKAGAGEEDQRLQAQRKEFIAAEQALRKGQFSRYAELAEGLRDYPLFPYLQFAELTRTLSRTDSEAAARFLRDNDGTPLADRFRRRWLDELHRRRDWSGYLAFYRPGNGTRRQCLYLQALLQTGSTKQVLALVPDLWLTGRSLPDACDPVLESWRQAGGLTPDLVWARIELAMRARRPKLARYLGRFLPSDEERRWLRHWLELDRRPDRLIRLEPKLREQDHPYRRRILLHAIERLARKDAAAAESAWEQLSRRYPFSADERYRARRSLLLAAMAEEPADLLDRLNRFQPRSDDTALLERRIRAGLKLQAWPEVQAWIERLPQTLAATERWRYWRARALEQQGHRALAAGLYQELAQGRSYYGFLAADRLGLPYNLSHTPLEVAPEQLVRVADRPGIRRARELYRLERLLDARREWRAATGKLSGEELQAASALAREWGWHTQAIFTLARTGYWEDLELRFPLEHREVVDATSRRRRLDDAWVFAVIRQESAFASDARSSAGAVGLMQLMPRTARHVARDLKRRPPRRAELLQPKINIDLGTAYLSQVLERLHDNPVLATSAYNAGPRRVKRWLPEQSQPADLWIETIPFAETRRYTQRVLTYAVIYEQRLGREAGRIASRMPDILPKPVATASRARKPVVTGVPPG